MKPSSHLALLCITAEIVTRMSLCGRVRDALATCHLAPSVSDLDAASLLTASPASVDVVEDAPSAARTCLYSSSNHRPGEERFNRLRTRALMSGKIRPELLPFGVCVKSIPLPPGASRSAAIVRVQLLTPFLQFVLSSKADTSHSW